MELPVLHFREATDVRSISRRFKLTVFICAMGPVKLPQVCRTTEVTFK